MTAMMIDFLVQSVNNENSSTRMTIALSSMDKVYPFLYENPLLSCRWRKISSKTKDNYQRKIWLG